MQLILELAASDDDKSALVLATLTGICGMRKAKF